MHDIDLYRSIAQSTASGENYYAAATRLQLENGYPTHPFFTVRLPTIAWLYATLGQTFMLLLAYSLFAAVLAVWLHRLRTAPLGIRIAFLSIVGISAVPSISVTSIFFGELWCGLLIGLALGLEGRKRLACAAAALVFREFAILFVTAIAATAAGKRDWRTVTAAAIVAAGFATIMALHAAAVMQTWQPGDLHSQGWHGMRGPAGLASDLNQVSALQLLPFWLAVPVALLPLAGWYRDSTALLWFSGFAALEMLFAREQNFYWALTLMPLYFAGIVYPATAWRQTAAKRATFEETASP